MCVVFVLPSVESDKGFREAIQKPFELILHIQTHEPNPQRDKHSGRLSVRPQPKNGSKNQSRISDREKETRAKRMSVNVVL